MTHDRHGKIIKYLRDNYDWDDIYDESVLEAWASYLDNDVFSKIVKNKLVITSQGAAKIGAFLRKRKNKTAGFKIDLTTLMRHVPNDTVMFQYTKSEPVFPVVAFHVYAHNKNLYDAFHKKYPTYLSQQERNRLSQHDDTWYDKYYAGRFFTSDFVVSFHTSIPNSKIIFTMSLNQGSSSLFKAELKEHNKTLSTIDCCSRDDAKTKMELKLSLLYVLLTQYEYDVDNLVQQIENDLVSFKFLVPDFTEQFTTIYTTLKKKNNGIQKKSNTAVGDLQKSNTIASVLLHNFMSWPLRPV